MLEELVLEVVEAILTAACCASERSSVFFLLNVELCAYICTPPSETYPYRTRNPSRRCSHRRRASGRSSSYRTSNSNRLTSSLAIEDILMPSELILTTHRVILRISRLIQHNAAEQGSSAIEALNRALGLGESQEVRTITRSLRRSYQTEIVFHIGVQRRGLGPVGVANIQVPVRAVLVVDARSGTALRCVVELYPDEIEPRAVQDVCEVHVGQNALWRSREVVALRLVQWEKSVSQAVDHLRVARCESTDRSDVTFNVEIKAVHYRIAPRTWTGPAGVDRSPGTPEKVGKVSSRCIAPDVVVCRVCAT